MDDINKKSEEKELALSYMKTLVDVARESFLILDADLRVLAVNPIFSQNFKVTIKETENVFLYDLGNGQWNIPELKRLLEEILPEKKEVKDYEVTHLFESIGERTILLNAKQIDSVQLIILSLEDITARKEFEEKTAMALKELEGKVVERTKELTLRVTELEALNKTMIGREIKMVELKKENEELKQLHSNDNNNNKSV